MRRILVLFPLLLPGPSARVLGAEGGPRVLIIYDMEGVSGISRESYTSFSSPDYPQGRKWLTSDVNAAIRGLKAGGAGAIWVQDGHGSGNSEEPDLLLDGMDSRASFDFRDRDYDPYSTGLDGSVSAIVCIGMHARANTPGFLAHTYTLEPAFKVNGIEFTETQIIALSAARWGIPVIMVSGDDVLGSQLRPEFPELEFAAVKTARGRALAEPLAYEEVQSRIEAAARTAMEKFHAGRFRPYYVAPPYVFEISFQNAAQAARARRDKSVEPAGNTAVRYRKPSFVEGYEFSKHLISLATGDRTSLLMRILNRHPDGKKILEEYERLLLDRWLQPETLPDWAQDRPTGPPKKRFHGDN